MIHDKIVSGIGRKQMGQSSFGGGSLNSASSRSSAARNLHCFFMLRPMILLASGVAIFDLEPRYVYMHRNEQLLRSIKGCRTLLRESFKEPTQCSRWPDFVGIVDASSHGVGGVVFGEKSKCAPTVFR